MCKIFQIYLKRKKYLILITLIILMEIFTENLIIELPKSNYMFLDTETTGINTIIDDIIQLSYFIYNENILVKKVNRYIIPEFCIISEFITSINGINNKLISEKGEKFTSVFNDFINDLKNIDCIVGHNVMFDIKMILSNLKKYNVTNINIFDNIAIECTMNMGIDTCNLYKKNGTKKYPKLSELYKKLFGKDLLGAHNAEIDVEACVKCYNKLKGKDD
jgi:DNA polymerase III alpha subunit (gram-positive type)